MTENNPSSLKNVATTLAAVAALIGVLVAAVQGARAFLALEQTVSTLQKKHDPGDRSELHPSVAESVDRSGLESDIDLLKKQHNPRDLSNKHPGLVIFAREKDVVELKKQLDALTNGSGKPSPNIGLVEVPIGSIIAWHKNGEGVPGNEVGYGRNWMECNGDEIRDPDSPLNGQFVPDLNGGRPEKKRPSGYPTDWFLGKQLFLRGHTVSGHFEEDAFQGHHHAIVRSDNLEKEPILSEGGGDGSYVGIGKDDKNQTQKLISADARTDSKHGEPRVGAETRPVNMSVVWIMRVK